MLGALDDDEVVLGLSRRARSRRAAARRRDDDVDASSSPSSCRCASDAPRAVRPLRVERRFSVAIVPQPRAASISSRRRASTSSSGDNGQGKTNLLEAIYVACDVEELPHVEARRARRLGGELASVRAHARRGRRRRASRRVGLEARGARLVRIDGKRPPTLAAYAVRTPVVVFHPGELTLSMGSERGAPARCSIASRSTSTPRRSPSSRRTRARCARGSARSRRAASTRAISTLGRSSSCATALRVMAHRAARGGARRCEARARRSRASPRRGSRSTARTRRRRPRRGRRVPRRARATSRPRDVRRGSAGVGPHRDDLVARARRRMPVRGVASQGQHRAVALALKAAEIAVIGRGARRAPDPAPRRRLERARSRPHGGALLVPARRSAARSSSRRRARSSSTRASSKRRTVDFRDCRRPPEHVDARAEVRASSRACDRGRNRTAVDMRISTRNHVENRPGFALRPRRRADYTFLHPSDARSLNARTRIVSAPRSNRITRTLNTKFSQ